MKLFRQPGRNLLFLAVFLWLAICSVAAAADRVGIFAGSFDPIHRGHLAIAEKALAELQLDRVIIVPNATNPKKPNISPLSRRIALIEDTIRDTGNPAIWVLPQSDIEQADAEGGAEDSFRRIVYKAMATAPNGNFFLLMGSDALKRSLKSWGRELGPNFHLVVTERPATPISDQLIRSQGKRQQDVIFLSPSAFDLSSTRLRKAAAAGNWPELRDGLTPSTLRSIVLAGSYGLASSSAWDHIFFQAFPPQSEEKEGEAKSPPGGPIVRSVPLPPPGEESRMLFQPGAMSPQVESIQFHAPHTLVQLRSYLAERLTEPGMKLIGQPNRSLAVVEGLREHVLGWIADTGGQRALEIVRDRDYITTSLFLVENQDGSTRLVYGGGIYGTSRFLHSEAMIAGALHFAGQPSQNVTVCRFRHPAEHSGLVTRLYREALSDVSTDTIDTVLIGFHGGVVKSLRERYRAWQTIPGPWSIVDHRLSEKLSRRSDFGETRSGKTWEIQTCDDEHLQHSQLAFYDRTGQQKRLLVTRNVYGDQLGFLIDLLVREKGIRRIILFGNSGGLTEAMNLGEIYVPCEVVAADGRVSTLDNSWHKPPPHWFSWTPKPARVSSVFSPLQETQAFINQLRQQGVELVEVETEALLPAQQMFLKEGRTVEFRTLLQVSDLPGTEQSLSELGQTKRFLKKSMTEGLDLILNEIDLVAPAPLSPTTAPRTVSTPTGPMDRSQPPRQFIHSHEARGRMFPLRFPGTTLGFSPDGKASLDWNSLSQKDPLLRMILNQAASFSCTVGFWGGSAVDLLTGESLAQANDIDLLYDSTEPGFPAFRQEIQRQITNWPQAKAKLDFSLDLSPQARIRGPYRGLSIEKIALLHDGRVFDFSRRGLGDLKTGTLRYCGAGDPPGINMVFRMIGRKTMNPTRHFTPGTRAVIRQTLDRFYPPGSENRKFLAQARQWYRRLPVARRTRLQENPDQLGSWQRIWVDLEKTLQIMVDRAIAEGRHRQTRKILEEFRLDQLLQEVGAGEFLDRL
jgi:nicotinate-nucleotide adenylyltransferase